MTEQTTYIEVGKEKILNVDADEYGSFIAITDNKSVLTNNNNLKIDIEVRFPIIRAIDKNTFLLVDCRTNNSDNGFIFDFEGKLIKSFLAGDGIEDVLIHRDRIVITYFDEGVLGEDGPNNDGISVFDFSGSQIFGFNSSAIWGHILDCYCICKNGVNRVLFYGYTELKVYELNLDTLKVETFETPDDFSGTTAISSKIDKIYFHSSYEDKEAFFFWNRKDNSVNKIGKYSSNLRGIGNGKFLAFGENGYTIVDPSE